MYYPPAEKKINKKFNSFTEEEQWLQHMLNEGWVLKGYHPEKLQPCTYYFDSIQYEEQKNRTYKIDYRVFRKEDDFLEYKSIFEDTGWTLLSIDKLYAKHIFYTNQPDANCTIFSDVESYKGREKRKMASARNMVLVSASFFIVSLFTDILYDWDLYTASILNVLLFGFPSAIIYYKHRKIYRSLMTK
ncbi:DUF2812 domain-containing protein [Priestia taiwanensis]|uniref:DUF2812 domain-containing protein n=1 Tax=Priestia taiwanensis TaxID=1347902 RepID=A0A917AUW2_9BACI|nr:DUF2812 domain-containing protein [Priestia taiwanensis]MBM7364143.1 hypothetical protein [Priestia taiwanensis]GGE71919.1 hypothetical protein GCM10007140_22370 [Priestia taiwanensis]